MLKNMDIIANLSLDEKLSILTNGARYVSKEEKACAPAHSFCIIPKKLTIWLQSVER